VEAENPDPSWIENRPWNEIKNLATLDVFKGLEDSVKNDTPA
jgi:hypothetical protein